MNIVSVPAAMMAAVSFYVGFYYLWIFARRRAEAENIAFALTCFCIAFYDLFCTGLYNASSPVEGMVWQRLQFAALALFVVAVSWFIFFFTNYKTKAPFIISTAWLSLLFILGISVRNELTLSAARPMVKRVLIGDYISITYNEVDPGLIYTVQYISMMLLCFFILYVVVRHYRNDDRRHARPILISLLSFFAVAINDTLVGAGVYPFIYLLEYAYMFIILSMAYVLQSRFIELHREVEELSHLLEDKIDERTMELFFSEIARNLYLDMFSQANAAGGEISGGDRMQGTEQSRQSLRKLSQDISIIANIDELLNRALMKAVEISGSLFGFLFILNDVNSLDLKVSRSSDDHPLPQVWEMVEYVFRTRKTLVSRGPGGEVGRGNGTAPAVNNVISIPIGLNDDIIGVCYLERDFSGDGFTDKDERLISAFISQAASAIENAFLYQRMINKDRQIRQISVTPSIEEKMKKAISYIKQNYRSDISREGLAASLNMHPDSFGRFFKIYTNKKINEYINELRIEDASRKLVETDGNIIDIAFSVGFESLPTFNRAFLKVIRLTPTQYREKHSKQQK